MLCPNCRASCAENDVYCRQCGEDLEVPSTSLIPTRSNLPAVLQNPQLPRLAAGMGALAVGVGIELLRRNLLARLTRSVRPSPSALPTLSGLREMLMPQQKQNKPLKLRRGYEVHETIVYLRRVIRRED